MLSASIGMDEDSFSVSLTEFLPIFLLLFESVIPHHPVSRANENGAAEPTWEYLIHISTLLEVMLNNYPMIFGNYSEVPWKKYVKIGKALENGHWPFVYQLCWKFVSKEAIQIKTVVLDLLNFADT